MNKRWERIEGGLWGMLIGDALGVPFEFCHHASLPDIGILNHEVPPGYFKSHPAVPVGTWSDDGAQALCMVASLLDCGQFDPDDFGRRLVKWYSEGYMAVDGFAFDVGNQTSQSICAMRNGKAPLACGLSGEYHNGNGSLMRVLPLALLHNGSEEDLVRKAHLQSCVTHAHPRSQICCALYCIWARLEMEGLPHAFDEAAKRLRRHYEGDPAFLNELETKVLDYDHNRCYGGSYVVDTLHSARIACGERSYEDAIRRAIRFGNDTDTTACLAGGIAGIRHKVAGIPYRWKSQLRGLSLLFPLLQKICMLHGQNATQDLHPESPAYLRASA
ncbi:MAG: ADP-ribosylglycohydrolase family protein [Opitutales bacterium]|nr:ADP-ribosylglycohydrolase family protein [Opitutales bacterium]